jgi:stage II sporulation protein GA (sporulation sigma-E factor processing peptidase)
MSKEDSEVTVYLDIFIIENLIVNFFLLYITTRTIRSDIKYKYIFFGACIGCVYGILMFYPVSKFICIFPMKLFVGIIMTIVVFRKKDILFILKSSIIFILYSMLLAGLCIFIEMNNNSYNLNSSFIINFTYKKLLLALMIIYIIIERIVVYVKDRKTICSLMYTIEVFLNGSQKTITAFLDTGNELKEPVTNLPVIIIEKEQISNFYICDDKKLYIPYKVVNGYNGKLEGFRPDLVKIHIDENEVRTKEVIIALCDNRLSKVGDYNALLSRGILE